MKRTQTIFGVSLLAIAMMSFGSLVQTTQAQDVVYVNKSAGGKTSYRGKISKVTPLGISIGAQTISAGNVKRISVGGAPASLSRAAERAEDGRYNDCLEMLNKITKTPSSKIAAAEIEYLRALCSAKLSLEGGSVTAQEAGKAVNNFVKNNPESYHLYPAIELKGKLLTAFNKPKLASQEFARLTRSGWPRYTAIGHFQVGEMHLAGQQFDQALASYTELAKVQATDAETQELKLIGSCQRAKALGLKGQTDQAIKVIQGIIQKEDPQNKRLFAYAYNALGACKMKKGELKGAALAFLHTDLLFASEASAHAEALYNLSKIWPQLGQTSRANEAQRLLRGRYRNTLWSRK